MWIGDKHLNDDFGAAAPWVLDVESFRILLAAREIITSAQIESRHLANTHPGLSQKKIELRERRSRTMKRGRPLPSIAGHNAQDRNNRMDTSARQAYLAAS